MQYQRGSPKVVLVSYISKLANVRGIGLAQRDYLDWSFSE